MSNVIIIRNTNPKQDSFVGPPEEDLGPGFFEHFGGFAKKNRHCLVKVKGEIFGCTSNV